MLILGLSLSGVGLIIVAYSGYILLQNLFVSDDELNMLSELPIEPSYSGFTGTSSGKNLPAAITDPDKLNKYRDRYITERKKERTKKWPKRAMFPNLWHYLSGFRTNLLCDCRIDKVDVGNYNCGSRYVMNEILKS